MGTGVATITNDDASTGPVAISVNNVWVAEQGGPAVFDVRLFGPVDQDGLGHGGVG